LSLLLIIPTLNATDTLATAIAPMRPAGLREVIVVDGGSSDGTVSVATAAGVGVVLAPRGCRTQLAAGAAAASGAWLLFLHANCRLEPGWEAAAGDFIGSPQAGGQAGYFDLVLDDPAPAARRLERIVASRCRLLDCHTAIGAF
jgi:glycosyltransferase involved in cell wall biosynthesis